MTLYWLEMKLNIIDIKTIAANILDYPSFEVILFFKTYVEIPLFIY